MLDVVVLQVRCCRKQKRPLRVVRAHTHLVRWVGLLRQPSPASLSCAHHSCSWAPPTSLVVSVDRAQLRRFPALAPLPCSRGTCCTCPAASVSAWEGLHSHALISLQAVCPRQCVKQAWHSNTHCYAHSVAVHLVPRNLSVCSPPGGVAARQPLPASHSLRQPAALVGRWAQPEARSRLLGGSGVAWQRGQRGMKQSLCLHGCC